MIRRVCEDTPRPIEDVNPEIPGWLIQIIDELLAKSPADRFQSASELAELLGQCLAHLQQPSVNPLPDRLEVQKFARVAGWRAPTRPRIWLAAAAAVLLLALGGLSLTEAAGLTNVAGTVIRIVRGDGTLVVQVDDPDVSVSIDGEELIITGAGANEIRLRPGEHNVHAIKDGKPVHSQLVSITRGGKEVVRVSLDLAQARTGYAYIDLQTKANHKLTESFPGYPGNNLAELPQGEQVLGGVKFNIGVGCISLNQKYGPAKVEGIPVGRSLRVLHILHGTVNGEGGGFVTAGTPIGEYRVHYDDGGTETIPIIHGEDVRDWWDWGWATAPDRSVVDVRGQASKRLKLAWRGTNELAKRFNRSDPIRLFLSTWENPSPDKRVVSIDYVATYTRTKPFCVAMSVGDSKDSSPLPVISRPGGGSQVGDTQRPNRPFFFTPWVAIADGMETINLSKTQLTDPDLVHLVGLTELKVLNLSSTPVSDAGLVHLRGLPNLQWLDLNDTRVTEAGVAGLQTALPDCLIKLTNRLVELTSPSRDANFEPEESVLLKAKTHVTGSSAEEGRVEFLVDGSPLISDKQSPFEANWLATTRGRHVLTARAFDERGRQYDSHSVSVFVGIRGLERSIESSADDAGEYGDGRMSLYSSDLDLMHIGTRFTDIRIPRGAQIKKAFLQFTADSVSRTDVPVERPDLTIHAELAASGKEFTTAEGDISSRKRTKASVKWSPEPWDVAYERSEKQRTPDLSSLIQEVVAQPDWSEGNALVLIIAGSGNREAVSFDGRRKGGAPVLYVEH